jgi:hypothetical protein
MPQVTSTASGNLRITLYAFERDLSAFEYQVLGKWQPEQVGQGPDHPHVFFE